MSTTSRIPAVVAGLVTTFGSVNATVFNRKWITNPDGDYLTVGWTPDDETPTARQEWGGLGNKARDEFMDIPCYIDCYSGDPDSASRVTAAYAILADCETLIRADPTLTGVLTQPGWAQIGEYHERIEQTEAGLAIGLVFHVIAQARL